jgi:hypothetical protein
MCTSAVRNSSVEPTSAMARTAMRGEARRGRVATSCLARTSAAHRRVVKTPRRKIASPVGSDWAANLNRASLTVNTAIDASMAAIPRRLWAWLWAGVEGLIAGCTQVNPGEQISALGA